MRIMKTLTKKLLLSASTLGFVAMLALGVSADEVTTKRATGYVSPQQTYSVDSIFDGSYPDYLYPAQLTATVNSSSYRNTKLPAVRNQGEYGTCWAQTTMACIEANLIKKGVAKTSINLSELPLISRYNISAADPLNLTKDSTKLSSNSCGHLLDYGGNFYGSSAVLPDGVALVSETKNSAYAYENASSLNLGESLSRALTNNTTYYLKGYYFVDTTSRQDMKKAILDYGAVGISYFSDASGYYGYGNDGYNSSGEASYYCPSYDVVPDHAVTVVGWDDNYSATNFTNTPNGNGAWIVRNSWGSGSLDNGYFYLSYYDHSIDSLAMAFEAESKGYQCDNIYQYDGDTTQSLYVFQLCTVSEASNVFKAQNTEYLNEVSFEVYSVNNNYTVSVYTNLSDQNNPKSGKLAAKKSGKTSFSGMIKVALDKSVKLAKGKYFSVVVEGSSASGDILFITDAYCNQDYYTRGSCTRCWSDIYYDIHTSEGSNSYVLFDGYYYSCDEYDEISNLRIKAFTTKTSSTKDDTDSESTETKPAATKITSVKPAAKGVQVCWKRNSKAKGYIIYKRIGKGSFKKVKTINSNKTVKWVDTKVSNGNSYSYKIVCYTKKSQKVLKSKYSSIVSLKCYLTKVKLTLNAVSSGVRVSWKRNAKATGYLIYRKTESGSYKLMKTVTKNTVLKWTDKKVKDDVTYTYKIVPYKIVDGKKILGLSNTDSYWYIVF